MTSGDVTGTAVAGAPTPAWARLLVVAGVLALVLGTVLAVLSVTVAGTYMTGVIVLDVALVLLAAGGIGHAVAGDA